MPLLLDLQCATEASGLPASDTIRLWAETALAADGAEGSEHELTVRLVDEPESAELNQRFRGREGPTNVLSFPFELPPGLPEGALDADLDGGLLGDLVICAPVVAREAAEQEKEPQAHWAHMVVHGVLHLLGHDHLEPVEAEHMEDLETQILVRLGFPPPYEVPETPS